MTSKFAKTLPTFGINYEMIPDPEPILPEGLLPTHQTQGNRHINTHQADFCPSQSLPILLYHHYFLAIYLPLSATKKYYVWDGIVPIVQFANPQC